MAVICKKCGYHQEDPENIKFLKKRWPHTEEHDIYYFCGACLDEATDEEYDNMIKLMNNPRFDRQVKDVHDALDKSMSYDEWAGREYGEDKVDVDDTAYNLVTNGIVKDSILVEEILDEIRTRYGIQEGEQKHTSHIAQQILNELMIHAYYPAHSTNDLKVVDEDDIKSVCEQYINMGDKK